MTEPNSDSAPEADFDSDLQEALAATFGADAMNLLADDGDDGMTVDLDADFAAAAEAMLEERTGNATKPTENALSELLSRLSEAVGAGAAVAPALLQQQESGQDQTVVVDQGPRHVVFEVGDQTFGLPLDGVLEIDRCGEITMLPRTPSWLRGVTNLRGQILSVTDFRNLLEVSDRRQTAGEKIIVIRSETCDASTAVVVDRVIGIRNLKAESGPIAGLNDRVVTFSSGIATVEDATTVLIDPDLLLGCTELQAFATE